ncbi:MAG: ABC transporter substrate-binding protein [Anaerolineaceae bacterium]|nr:ABC transporter substrate-binding protein [Anaerolineaceae bacterium]
MKKVLLSIISIILITGFLAGCTQTATTSVLEKIKKDGKVLVGTSADYPPYEFVDSTGKKAGFDIELMEEIAKRLGVSVEWVDMPFDSLIAAVKEGKINMSISCFNYSEERAKEVGFSKEYFNSEDSFIANKDFTGKIEKPEDAAQYKLGVQSGTVQDTWIKENLLDKGLIKEENVQHYERVDQAALDLEAGRIQVLMSDYVPAKALLKAHPGFQMLYHSAIAAAGPINIVLPIHDEKIKTEIDKIIDTLKEEGFIDKLAAKHFGE